jgi:hypothetical protein
MGVCVNSRIAVLTGAVAAVMVIVGSASGASRPTPTVADAGGHANAPAVTKGSGVVLFSNNTNDAGIGISSQNFEPAFAGYDDVAADDFFVPAHTTWHVTEVDVSGVYYNGSPGPADSETVTFYKNGHRQPGTEKVAYTLLGTDNAGSFAIDLPGKGVTFRGGTRGKTFWLSVVANMNFHPKGQWAWETSTNAIGNPNVWENPSNGFGTGCTAWTVVNSCFPGEGASQMFALFGSHNP